MADDIDDLLNDLLADDDLPKKKPAASSGRGALKKSAPGKKTSDEDFYSSMAADTSDVSDADPNEIAKSLDDMDSMDDFLFSGKKPAPAKQTPAAKTATNEFTDDADPLADLLGDDKGETKNPPASRRLDIERPPTRSGNNTPQSENKSPAGRGRKRDEINFDDDDDLLGGIGLDSPRKAKESPLDIDSSANHKPKNTDGSLMGDLFGSGSSSRHLEKPGSGGERREFFLDKLNKSSTQTSAAATKPTEKEPKEEDFQFGSYMPSAASNNGSRPSSRRSVRFEEDEENLGDRPASRAGSGGAGRRRQGGAASYLEDMLAKDESDWLDMASGGKQSAEDGGKKEEERPRSEPSLSSDKLPAKPGTAQSAASEPVDWLGLSRIGSPDSPRPPDPPFGSSTEDVLRVRESAKKSQPIKVAEADDDDEDENDGWLAKIKARRAEKAQKESVTDLPKASNKVDDWLGGHNVSSSNEAKSSGGDFLGLGEEVDLDTLLGSKTTSKPSLNDQRTEELFKTPAKRDSSSLPWETDGMSKDRRQSRQSSDMGEGRRQKRDSSPSKPAPEKPGEDELDLFGDLDKPRTSQPPKSLPIQQDPGGLSAGPTSVANTLPAATRVPDMTGEGSNIQMPAAVPPINPGLSTGGFQQSQQLQQHQLLQQQQQQQQATLQTHWAQQMDSLQKQMADQQENLRRQQQQQLQQMQQAQQSLIQQQPPMMTFPPLNTGMSLPIMGTQMAFTGFNEASDPKAAQLEMEKNHLQMILQTTQQQHSEQLRILEESYQKRLQTYEETFSKRETRLKEENDWLLEQNNLKQKTWERERSELEASLNGRVKEAMTKRDEHITSMHDLHRQELERLKAAHEEDIARLRRVKDQEVEAVASTHLTSKNLQAVMDQVQTSTRDLDDLHKKVEGQHSSSLGEREISARNRDQQLKGMYELLEKQHQETERERARLQGLVTTLNQQLNDQARQLEEERWRIKKKKVPTATMR